ncbi:MAG: Asp-tRNA(Asn)/Glu-tRNA(Gln) amidotransferase subunit GatC [bacterium]
MANITFEQVKHVAALAKLEFREDELQAMADDLSKIVQYVEKLNELDLENVLETAHVLDLTNVFRKDQAKKWLSQEEALANAPARNKGYFSVPKVIDKEK